MEEHRLTEMQERLLDVFKRTIQFLEKNNLRWWTDGGTTIGAVRHHGFIPWDDDLDIMMPYEDYARLLKMKDEFQNTDLALDIPFEENNCCTYAKIYDTNSTIWQEQRHESIIGLWVDIFPMYSTDMSLEEYKQCKKEYTALNQAYLLGKQKLHLSEFIFLLKGFHLNSLLTWLKVYLYYKWILPNTITKSKALIETLDNPEGKYYMFPHSYYNRNVIYPKEWFKDIIKMPFEDIEVNVISGYDELLREQFGDYMQLPPVEQRVSHHPMYYCNLKEHLTIEEVRQRLKKGEKYVY